MEMAFAKCYNLVNIYKNARYCQGTKLNTQDTLKSISKEIGFFYLAKAIEQATIDI